MSQEEIKQIVKTAIAEYEAEHPCKLSVEERAMVHAQHDAMVEEGGNHGTWRVIVQWGVNMTDVTKQVRKCILWVLAFIAVVAFLQWKFK